MFDERTSSPVHMLTAGDFHFGERIVPSLFLLSPARSLVSNESIFVLELTICTPEVLLWMTVQLSRYTSQRTASS